MLSHINEDNQPEMVDISGKAPSHRTATAGAIVALPPEIRKLFSGGDIASPKGPVIQTAIIAGTLAVKKTAEWIPFCHPVAVEKCKFRIQEEPGIGVRVECAVATTQKTGVEMEALTGASAAALTIYDMCKSISHEIVIRDLRLLEKTGGKSDFVPGRKEGET
jgi:cyclic pyranopterin monophosphate synthase